MQQESSTSSASTPGSDSLHTRLLKDCQMYEDLTDLGPGCEVLRYVHLVKSYFILLVFRFWKINAGLFPLLSFLARFVLCVPAASSKSERVFSVAGQVVTGKRR